MVVVVLVSFFEVVAVVLLVVVEVVAVVLVIVVEIDVLAAPKMHHMKNNARTRRCGRYNVPLTGKLLAVCFDFELILCA